MLNRSSHRRKAVLHLSKADRTLARFIRKVGPAAIKLKEAHTPFEALLEAIVYQQLTGKAAATILGRVIALFPRRAFPSPDDILAASEERLRGAGLSWAKIAAIKDLAEKTNEGVVPRSAEIQRLSDSEIIERLTSIRGVGRWTVEMLLIFNLGRHDIIPSTDYGVRKGFKLAYGLRELPSPKEIESFAERWRPYRSVAAWYLWRVLELPLFKSEAGEASSVPRARGGRPAATKPKGARPSRPRAKRKRPVRAPV